jgi:hypothetical protein
MGCSCWPLSCRRRAIRGSWVGFWVSWVCFDGSRWLEYERADHRFPPGLGATPDVYNTGSSLISVRSVVQLYPGPLVQLIAPLPIGESGGAFSCPLRGQVCPLVCPFVLRPVVAAGPARHASSWHPAVGSTSTRSAALSTPRARRGQRGESSSTRSRTSVGDCASHDVPHGRGRGREGSSFASCSARCHQSRKRCREIGR